MRQRTHQVGTGDDADQLPLSQHRDAVDAVGVHQRRNLAGGCGFGHSDRVRRHEYPDLAVLLLDLSQEVRREIEAFGQQVGRPLTPRETISFTAASSVVSGCTTATSRVMMSLASILASSS